MIRVTGRVVAGKEGRKLPTTGMFFTNCVLCIHRLIGCPCRIFFSGTLECRIFFSICALHEFFVLYFDYPPPPPPPTFTFLMVRPIGGEDKTNTRIWMGFTDS